MKIYFAGSIRGGRQDQEIYFSIINELTKYGTVLTEHIGQKNLSEKGEQNLTEQFIFERDMAWVREADVLVGEVTAPSLGVGYEIGQAESMDKKILLLYRSVEGKKLSAMLLGNTKVKVAQYETFDDARAILAEYFDAIGQPKTSEFL